jgi:NAD(P)-dependent dehydrogenase (short-subunit alcohol dehydrogenase family)
LDKQDLNAWKSSITMNSSDNKVILVTGASSGFGRMAANALAQSGHIVYASMRETKGRNAAQVADVEAYAKEHAVELRAIELDVGSQASVDAGVAALLDAHGRIDVIVHNAGHMVFGPCEAFTPEQLAALYDINVLSTQRVNRAALPHMRKQRRGLLVWVSSSSSAGGTPIYLAPYFAAKAGMDALAVQYARELSRWGIEHSRKVRITSHTPAVRPTRLAQPSTTPGRTAKCLTRSRRRSVGSFRRMLIRVKSRRRS